jgi:hypothetical protein
MSFVLILLTYFLAYLAFGAIIGVPFFIFISKEKFEETDIGPISLLIILYPIAYILFTLGFLIQRIKPLFTGNMKKLFFSWYIRFLKRLAQ